MRKKSILRYTFFLTLRNTSEKITREEVVDRLNQIGFKKVFLVVEMHRTGEEHMHVLCQHIVGLSKNTYIETFRKVFPEMEGMQLDVKGVKSLGNIVRYMLKRQPDLRKVLCVGFKMNDLLKAGGLGEYGIYIEMGAFDYFEEWENASVNNKVIAMKKMKLVEIL